MKSGGNSANIVETRQKFMLTSNRSCPIIDDMKKTRHHWTREEWNKWVLFYGNASTMQKENLPLYHYGHHLGWTKDTIWPNRKSRWGLDEKQLKDNVFNHSRECRSRGEFHKKYPQDYSIALDRKWLDEMVWLKPQKNPYRDDINYVYIYVFDDTKTFYVGLSHHGSIRHWQHENCEDSPVFRYAKDNNVAVPKPIILDDNLSQDDALILEDYWKLHYINLGWKTLNKGKTGEFSGSLGGTVRIWTYEKCKECALKCSHFNEMRRKFPSAAVAAWKNGWTKDYVWFKVVSGKARPILQYTKNGQFVRRWNSIRQASKEIGHSVGNIHSCINGKQQSAAGFVWRYADNADDVPAEPVQMSLAI